MAGVLLTSETKAQKAWGLMGASGGGKGTAIRTLMGLLGSGMVSTNIKEMGEKFGLEHAIDARVIFIPELDEKGSSAV